MENANGFKAAAALPDPLPPEQIDQMKHCEILLQPSYYS